MQLRVAIVLAAITVGLQATAGNGAVPDATSAGSDVTGPGDKIVDATGELIKAAIPKAPTAKDFCQDDGEGDRVGFCDPGSLKPTVKSGKDAPIGRRQLIDNLNALCREDGDSRVGLCDGIVPTAKLDKDTSAPHFQARNAGMTDAILQLIPRDLSRRATSVVRPCRRDANEEQVEGFAGLCKRLVGDDDMEKRQDTQGGLQEGSGGAMGGAEQGFTKGLQGAEKGYAADAKKAKEFLQNPPKPGDLLTVAEQGATSAAKGALSGGIARRQAIPGAEDDSGASGTQKGIQKGFEGAKVGLDSDVNKLKSTIKNPPKPGDLLTLAEQEALSVAKGAASGGIAKRQLNMVLPCAKDEEDKDGEAGFCQSLIPVAHEREVTDIIRRSLEINLHRRFVKRRA